jgi:hypothetical protein
MAFDDRFIDLLNDYWKVNSMKWVSLRREVL